jgi:hypothetical protein
VRPGAGPSRQGGRSCGRAGARAAMPASVEHDGGFVLRDVVSSACRSDKGAALSPDGSASTTQGLSAALSPAYSDGSGAQASSQSQSSGSPGEECDEGGSVSDACSSGSGSEGGQLGVSRVSRGASEGGANDLASRSSSSGVSTAAKSALSASSQSTSVASPPLSGGGGAVLAGQCEVSGSVFAPAPAAAGSTRRFEQQGPKALGPAPKGMRWNVELSQWVPRGDAPAGLTWDCAKSRWTQVTFAEGVAPLSFTHHCEWEEEHGRWVLAPLPDTKTKPLYASSRIFSSSERPGHVWRALLGQNRRSGRLPRRELHELDMRTASTGPQKRPKTDQAVDGASRAETGSPPCLDAVHGAVQPRRPTPQRASPAVPAQQLQLLQQLSPQPLAALSSLLGVCAVPAVPGAINSGSTMHPPSLFPGLDLSPVLQSVLHRQQQHHSPEYRHASPQLLDPGQVKPLQYAVPVPVPVPVPVHVNGAMLAVPHPVGALVGLGLGLGVPAPPQVGAFASPVVSSQQQALLHVQAQVQLQHQMLQQIVQQLEQQQHALFVQQQQHRQLKPPPQPQPQEAQQAQQQQQQQQIMTHSLPSMAHQVIPNASVLLAGLGMSHFAAQSTLDGALSGMLALPQATCKK